MNSVTNSWEKCHYNRILFAGGASFSVNWKNGNKIVVLERVVSSLPSLVAELYLTWAEFFDGKYLHHRLDGPARASVQNRNNDGALSFWELTKIDDPYDFDRLTFTKYGWSIRGDHLDLPKEMDLDVLVRAIQNHPGDKHLLIELGLYHGLIDDQLEKAMLLL